MSGKTPSPSAFTPRKTSNYLLKTVGRCVKVRRKNNYRAIYNLIMSCIHVFFYLSTETAPLIVPFLPVKDIADEVKGKLTQDMESSTPPDLKTAMKSIIFCYYKNMRLYFYQSLLRPQINLIF